MRKNVFFKAIRQYFGRRQWRCLCASDVNYALDSITRYPADYGLTGEQSRALDNAVYSLSYGINTGRMPTDAALFWKRLGTQHRVELICEMAQSHGNESVGIAYAAWRDRLCELTQEKARREAEACAAMSAAFAGETTGAPC